MNTLIPLGGKTATGQISNAEEIARLREYQKISAPVDKLPSILNAPLKQKTEIARIRRMLLHRAYIALYPNGAEAYKKTLASLPELKGDVESLNKE